MASERWPNGGSRAWRKLRAEVVERDGGRCTHVVDGDGNEKFVQGDKVPAGWTRCEKTARLEVHHARPGPAVEADLEDLFTVCKPHHPKPDAKWQADSASAAAEAAIKLLPEELLDIRSLMPAVWNANHVHEATMKRIANSVREFGIVENNVVRPHPEFPGKYEVLSGNHRLTIYKRFRVKKVPCRVVDVDDAMARVLAQMLNRERGVDDPQKLAALMDEITAALPRDRVDEFLGNLVELPKGGLDGKAMTRLLEYQRGEAGVGYQFKPIHPMKLGHRLEACCHPRRMGRAVELFAGRGQLTFWYARLFERVVRVDSDAEGKPDHCMTATEYIRTQLLKDGPFDLVDFDDEGSPHEELDAFFEVIKGKRLDPFVLCVTDGLAHRLKMIRKVPTDLMAVYRWPEKTATGKHLYLRCPELLDHGVRARAEEAGYTAETIAVDWKPGKSATFGSWVIGPEDDARSQIEKDLEPADSLPEAWGAWRIEPKPRERKPPVQPVKKEKK
jgi:hypothetical protein